MKNKTKEPSVDIYKTSTNYHKKICISEFPKNELPQNMWPDSWKKIYHKEYLRFSIIPLILEKRKLSKLEKIISLRKSERNFDAGSLKYESLSRILKYSSGYNKDKNARNYPSAGARYPIEVYLINNKVKGIGKYSYHYNVKRDSLERMFKYDDYKKLISNITNQQWVKSSACLIVLTAVFNRNRIKYGDRGYNYSLIEAGHIAQNIYLLCTNNNIKCCAIGGFVDKYLNIFLELREENEAAIYLLAIGK